jgi:anti-sigma factor ChrR (cupin superfamily)
MTSDPNLQSVKILRDLIHIRQWQQSLPWQPFQEGVEIHRLYGDGQEGPCAALLKFRPGGRVPRHEHTGWEHIFILSGSQTDEQAKSGAGTLIINPPGTSHAIISETGCIVLAIYERPVKFL